MIPSPAHLRSLAGRKGITHDLKEAFALATRVLPFDKVRWDPQAPGAYGVTITSDLPLNDKVERQELLARWAGRLAHADPH